MDDRFVSFEIESLLVGVPLPVSIYVFLDNRFITFRAAGDHLDRATFDRLQFKKVRFVFLAEQDAVLLDDWANQQKQEGLSAASSAEGLAPELQNLAEIRSEVRRTLLDIFQNEHPDKMVGQAFDASRKLVDEIMTFPLTVRPLTQLQVFSQGTVDHSINVSILSVYLAIQMGYAHQIILQNLALGALLHDVGKAKVPLTDEDTPVDIERKMQEHPAAGLSVFDASVKVPEEVKMIIVQHHECNDGTGFPKSLKGPAIYDLAKIVSIANVFDELVGSGTGPLVNRQREALKQLDETLFRKFDPQKLEKTLKILKMGV